MLVGNGPERPMHSQQDLVQLYQELIDAWHRQRSKALYSQCVPALLKPSNERSMDERCLAIWCIDHAYTGLGTYFPVIQTDSVGHTASEALEVFAICGHYIFDSMFALNDMDVESPLEVPIAFKHFAQLWTFSEADQQLVIEPKKATTRNLSKAFPLVGAQLKKTPGGRAILSGLDGQEEAHHYYSGHRTKHGGKVKRRKAKVVPTYSTEEQDARYLGSWVWADMHKELGKGGRSVPTSEVLDYIRGPHVPQAAKQKLVELGVWREFEEMEDDGKKISVDHIVPHDWGATNHPMNYFLLPKGLNSQFNARNALYEDGKGHKMVVTKKELVGMSAFNTAISFHRVFLAVEHGFMMVEEAMEIARNTAPKLAQFTDSPATQALPMQGQTGARRKGRSRVRSTGGETNVSERSAQSKQGNIDCKDSSFAPAQDDNSVATAAAPELAPTPTSTIQPAAPAPASAQTQPTIAPTSAQTQSTIAPASSQTAVPEDSHAFPPNQAFFHIRSLYFKGQKPSQLELPSQLAPSHQLSPSQLAPPSQPVRHTTDLTEEAAAQPAAPVQGCPQPGASSTGCSTLLVKEGARSHSPCPPTKRLLAPNVDCTHHTTPNIDSTHHTKRVCVTNNRPPDHSGSKEDKGLGRGTSTPQDLAGMIRSLLGSVALRSAPTPAATQTA